MPLLDHFHPPLYPRHRWHGFHNAWATYLAAALNQTLPAEYFAAPNVQFTIEIDTAVLREENIAYAVIPNMATENGSNGAVVTEHWHPPTPSQTIHFDLAGDTIEVLINSDVDGDGPRLVGAIELVSPANKDRPAQRSAFTAKCESYLCSGIGLLIIDIVTNRNTNLHNELMQRIEPNPLDGMSVKEPLYTVAYHPTERDKQPLLDLWYNSLSIGQELPTMPLWLLDGPCMPVDLETVYRRTCTEQRISTGIGAAQ